MTHGGGVFTVVAQTVTNRVAPLLSLMSEKVLNCFNFIDRQRCLSSSRLSKFYSRVGGAIRKYFLKRRQIS